MYQESGELVHFLNKNQTVYHTKTGSFSQQLTTVILRYGYQYKDNFQESVPTQQKKLIQSDKYSSSNSKICINPAVTIGMSIV